VWPARGRAEGPRAPGPKPGPRQLRLGVLIVVLVVATVAMVVIRNEVVRPLSDAGVWRKSRRSDQCAEPASAGCLLQLGRLPEHPGRELYGRAG
jgi:hypothetical protein